ncbi:MAG: sigma-70 family RNA polymerase sigma factor [Chloroflexi bacterium]|nr:sigma-70 family RNA polymerase sigma factor [Chloroflexota bacterium]
MTGSDPASQGAAALADLFEQCYGQLAGYIFLRIGNRADADEMAGEVFLRALEAVDSFEWRGIPMRAWLFRIAHNLVVDHLRRRDTRPTAPLDDALPIVAASNPGLEVEQRLQLEEVYRAMEHLNPAQREVIGLRLIGGLSAAEAGQAMGRTPGAIRELQRTALRALRKHLGVALSEEE